ncbi:hypothetical protein LCGC14_1747520 [marine sediment metagenome]|uniref:Uncharacterized protein n=1 Tax=marine sediment metagenome TaxID=412755 RepID=A0A0F9HS73_9ZZZZ
MKVHNIHITVDELRTLAGSAIADIHGQVDELYADGLRRNSNCNWTAADLGEKRDELIRYFQRAIDLCDTLEHLEAKP